MKYTPKKEKGATWICVASVIAIGLLGGTISLDLPYKVLFEVAAFLLCVLTLEMFIRYVLTEYSYSIEGDDFIVMKRVGRRTQYVCNLSLRTAIGLFETRSLQKEKAEESDYGHIQIRYDFCQTIRKSGAYSLLFEFNDKIAEIKFQPNEEMRSQLQRILENGN